MPSNKESKSVLKSLNFRLAAYIGRYKDLEKENDALKEKLVKNEKTLQNVREEYDQELLGAHRIIEDLEVEGKRLDLECAQLRDLKETLEEGVVMRNLELELLRLRLDVEIQRGVDLESKLEKKVEDLEATTRCYEEEIGKMRTQRIQEFEEVYQRIKKEYDVQLQSGIEGLRSEYEDQIRAYEEELDGFYDQLKGEMQAQLEICLSSPGYRDNELASLLAQVESLTKQIELEGHRLQKKLEGLETSMYIRNLFRIKSDSLVLEKEAVTRKHQILMNAKNALANGMANFWKLVEAAKLTLSEQKQGTFTTDDPRSGAESNGNTK